MQYIIVVLTCWCHITIIIVTSELLVVYTLGWDHAFGSYLVPNMNVRSVSLRILWDVAMKLGSLGMRLVYILVPVYTSLDPLMLVCTPGMSTCLEYKTPSYAYSGIVGWAFTSDRTCECAHWYVLAWSTQHHTITEGTIMLWWCRWIN